MVTPLEMETFIEIDENDDVPGNKESGKLAGDLNEGDRHKAAPEVEVDKASDESALENIGRKAFDEGYAKGKADGLEEGGRRVEPALEGFIESARELGLFREKLLKNSEKDLVDLIIAAARKIVHKEISTDRDVIAAVIKSALKNLTDRKDVIIYVNPEDHRFIAENKKRFFGDVDDLKEISFLEDETIERGGCLIESKYGEVDARIKKQFDETVEHVTNQKGMIDEFNRVLKHNGLLILSSPNCESLISRIYYLLKGMFPHFTDVGYHGTGHVSPLFSWSLKRFIEKDMKIIRYTSDSFHLWIIPYLLKIKFIESLLFAGINIWLIKKNEKKN